MSARESRRTRIVATLGPTSASEPMVRRLVTAGVDVFRLNFSHGTRTFHRQAARTVRRVASRLGVPVALMQDLSGPKMRVGRLENDSQRLRRDASIELIEGSGLGTAARLYVEAAGVLRRLGKGDAVRLADGTLELVVQRRSPKGIRCRVVHGGTLRSRQGVNIPGVDLGVRALTEKDEQDLRFGLELGVDAVALSFVSDAEDVMRLRRRLASWRRGPFVVAKIERDAALGRLEEILEVTSGVMVARGDLGVEIGVEKVPGAQKRIIEAAIRHHKPVITATQMLESMIDRPTPTRAEVSDVAHAVAEGTDALMLSGETAVGGHAVAAVQTLVDVAREAEAQLPPVPTVGESQITGEDVAQAVCRAARLASRTVGARALVGFTNSGRTVRLLSSQRPRRPCYGFTHTERTLRRMRFFWGVTPLKISRARSVEAMIAEAEQMLRARRLVRRGDRLVLVCGQAVHTGATNTIRIHTVG